MELETKYHKNSDGFVNWIEYQLFDRGSKNPLGAIFNHADAEYIVKAVNEYEGLKELEFHFGDLDCCNKSLFDENIALKQENEKLKEELKINYKLAEEECERFRSQNIRYGKLAEEKLQLQQQLNKAVEMLEKTIPKLSYRSIEGDLKGEAEQFLKEVKGDSDERD